MASSLWRPIAAMATTAPLVIAFSDHVATIGICEGRSMQPTINKSASHRTVVLLDKWSARANSLARGDVVILHSPVQDGAMVLKRMLAVGGDYVSRFRANNDDEPVYVPKGHIWLEGDHTALSMDSNCYGPVRAERPRGRAIHS